MFFVILIFEVSFADTIIFDDCERLVEPHNVHHMAIFFRKEVHFHCRDN